MNRKNVLVFCLYVTSTETWLMLWSRLTSLNSEESIAFGQFCQGIWAVGMAFPSLLLYCTLLIMTMILHFYRVFHPEGSQRAFQTSQSDRPTLHRITLQCSYVWGGMRQLFDGSQRFRIVNEGEYLIQLKLLG